MNMDNFESLYKVDRAPKKSIDTLKPNSKRLQSTKVYLINLDRRPDRLTSAMTTLRRAGFRDIERISAVDGKLIDSDQLKQIVDPNELKMMGKTRIAHESLGSVGAVGCYLSHYKAWSRILQSGVPGIIVEDDLICHPLINEFEISKDKTPLDNYDMVLLAANVREPECLPKNYSEKQAINRYNGMFFLLHFYYITPEGARFFLEGAIPIKYQVDSYMSFKMKDHKEFKSAIHVPPMATQRDLRTDIQTPMDSEKHNMIINVVNSHPKPTIAILLFLISVAMLFCALQLIQLMASATTPRSN